MKDLIHDLLQAFSILTILPVGLLPPSDAKRLGRSMAFFPVVGLVIGLLSALSYFLLSLLLPRPVALWLTIGVSTLVSGGLHLDGFADTLDGLACRGSKEKILEVMRDSRVGSFGVIGLIFLIGAKYFALDQIPVPLLLCVFVLMAVVGRNGMVLVCYRSPYARSGEGLAKAFTETLGSREVILSLVLTLVLSFLLGPKGVLVYLGTILFSLSFRKFFIRKLSGVTGDILGAAGELTELLSLLLVLVLRPIPVIAI